MIIGSAHLVFTHKRRFALAYALLYAIEPEGGLLANHAGRPVKED
jgi:hypothetical protein